MNIANGGQLLGSTAAIPLTCVLTTACKGLLRLTGLPGAAAAPQSAAVHVAAVTAKSFGQRRFSIRAGKTASIRVQLSAAGKKKLRHVTSVVLVATVQLRSGVVSGNVELTRQR